MNRCRNSSLIIAGWVEESAVRQRRLEMTAEFTPYQEFNRAARASVAACARHIHGRLVLSRSVVGIICAKFWLRIPVQCFQNQKIDSFFLSGQTRFTFQLICFQYFHLLAPMKARHFLTHEWRRSQSEANTRCSSDFKWFIQGMQRADMLKHRFPLHASCIPMYTSAYPFISITILSVYDADQCWIWMSVSARTSCQIALPLVFENLLHFILLLICGAFIESFPLFGLIKLKKANWLEWKKG